MIEILQDEQIRDHLNPVSKYPSQQNDANSYHYSQDHHNHQQEDDPNGLDDEDLDEILAMQEECRLEMMKFYIQSQNPNLFEEIYHDVSYPEGVNKEMAQSQPPVQQQQQTTKQQAESEKKEAESSSPKETTTKEANPGETSVAEKIKPVSQADESLEKLADLKLTDEKK